MHTKKIIALACAVTAVLACGGFTTVFLSAEHTITYDLNGGSFAEDTTVTETTHYLDSVDLPDAKKEHYTLKGWMDEEGKTLSDSLTHVTKDITLTANYAPKVYRVKFYDGEEFLQSALYAYGDEMSLDETWIGGAEETHPYEDFDFWKNTDGENVESATAESFGDMDLYASWKGKTYTISYELDGGAVTDEPKSYTYGTGVETLPSATKDGYTFDGWFSDAEHATKIDSISTDMHADITLYADYTKNVVQQYVASSSNNSSGSNTTSSSGTSTGANASSSGSASNSYGKIVIPQIGYWAELASDGQAAVDRINCAYYTQAVEYEYWDFDAEEVRSVYRNYALVYDHNSHGLANLPYRLSAGDVIYVDGVVHTYSGVYYVNADDIQNAWKYVGDDYLDNFSILIQTCVGDGTNFWCLFY